MRGVSVVPVNRRPASLSYSSLTSLFFLSVLLEKEEAAATDGACAQVCSSQAPTYVVKSNAVGAASAGGGGRGPAAGQGSC